MEPKWIEHDRNPISPVPVEHDIERRYANGAICRDCRSGEHANWHNITHYRDWTALKSQFPIEIERRFLVDKEFALRAVEGKAKITIEQSYLTNTGEWAVRARRVRVGESDQFYLTLKKNISHGQCYEIESIIEESAFQQIKYLAGKSLIKTRTVFNLGCGNKLELDIFDHMSDYAIAEVEVKSLDTHIELPEWLDTEVTGVYAFSNLSMFNNM